MRRCPECETIYEDHVVQCLADGAELVAATEATAIPGARVAAPPPSSGSMVPWLITLAMGGFVIAVLLAVIVWLSTSGDSTPPQAPEPVVTPAPAPSPEPAPPAVLTIVTEPAGAQVRENERILCVTPCELEHADGAPLPRTFELRLEGYEAESYTVNEPGGRHRLRLVPEAAPEPAAAQPAPSPRPAAPAPRQPRPTPAPVERPPPPPPQQQPTPQPPAPEPPTPAPAPAPDVFERVDEIKDPFR